MSDLVRSGKGCCFLRGLSPAAKFSKDLPPARIVLLLALRGPSGPIPDRACHCSYIYRRTLGRAYRSRRDAVRRGEQEYLDCRRRRSRGAIYDAGTPASAGRNSLTPWSFRYVRERFDDAAATKTAAPEVAMKR